MTFPSPVSVCVQVKDRLVWRSALEAGNYELLCSDGRENGGMNGRVEAMEVDSPAQLRARDRYADTQIVTDRVTQKWTVCNISVMESYTPKNNRKLVYQYKYYSQ